MHRQIRVLEVGGEPTGHLDVLSVAVCSEAFISLEAILLT